MTTNEGDAQHGPEDMTPELVTRLRDGNPAAGVLLDRLYRDALVRFCWGYLNRIEEAEDAVQDVCFKVLASKTIPDSFRPWVYRLARNHCFNLLRSRSRRADGVALPAASQVLEQLTGQLTKLVRNERQLHLGAIVQRLPEAQQEVLRLRYVEGLGRSEIAEVLELTESVVKSRLFEGIKQLREQAELIEDT